MATTEDARAGWEFYRSSGFSLSREEINERLMIAGFSPIAARTYEHYRRLERRGYRRYLSINRLDTMGLPDPFQDESIRSRYSYSKANVPSQVILHLPSAEVEVVGRADALSDLGTEIIIDDVNQMQALRAAPPASGTSCTVNFLHPAATAHGSIDFVGLLDPDAVRIGILFRQLIRIDELTGESALPAYRFHFTLSEPGDERSLDAVSQEVYWLLQGIEGARGVVNLLLDAYSDSRVIALPPTVQRLTVASPLDAWLEMSVHVYLTLNAMISRVAGIGAHAKAGAKAVLSLLVHLADADLTRAQADHIRAQTEGLRIDNERRMLATEVLAEASSQVITELRQRGDPVNESPSLNTERLLQLLFNDLEPSAYELTQRGIELEVGDPDEAE